nr:PREDICTED: uncharacterized protein LOC104144970 [Struthio camelus australis]
MAHALRCAFGWLLQLMTMKGITHTAHRMGETLTVPAYNVFGCPAVIRKHCNVELCHHRQGDQYAGLAAQAGIDGRISVWWLSHKGASAREAGDAAESVLRRWFGGVCAPSPRRPRGECSNCKHSHKKFARWTSSTLSIFSKMDFFSAACLSILNSIKFRILEPSGLVNMTSSILQRAVSVVSGSSHTDASCAREVASLFPAMSWGLCMAAGVGSWMRKELMRRPGASEGTKRLLRGRERVNSEEKNHGRSENDGKDDQWWEFCKAGISF